eukprot:gene4580-9092_t
MGGSEPAAAAGAGELRWSGLRYAVAVPAEGCCRGAEAAGKVVLSDVSGSAAPGQVLAIMGPS